MKNFMPASDQNNSLINLKRFTCCRDKSDGKADMTISLFVGSSHGEPEIILQYDSNLDRDLAYTIMKEYINALFPDNYEFCDIANTIIFDYQHIDYITHNPKDNTELILGYDDLEICLKYENPTDANAQIAEFVKTLLDHHD